jgi:hypothetical protein
VEQQALPHLVVAVVAVVSIARLHLQLILPQVICLQSKSVFPIQAQQLRFSKITMALQSFLLLVGVLMAELAAAQVALAVLERQQTSMGELVAVQQD